MMKALNNDIAKPILIDVFEKFAFLFCEFHTDVPPCPDCDLFKADINLRGGGYNSRLDIILPADVTHEMAVNALGLDFDEQCPPEDQIDALRELMNQLGGRLITEVAGEHVAFDIFIPNAGTAAATDWEQLAADPSTIGILVDERPMLFRLRIESESQ